MRMVLNMARAALIREREFRRVPGGSPGAACTTAGTKAEERRAANGERTPRYTGGQKCAQKIAANLNC